MPIGFFRTCHNSKFSKCFMFIILNNNNILFLFVLMGVWKYKNDAVHLDIICDLPAVPCGLTHVLLILKDCLLLCYLPLNCSNIFSPNVFFL